MRKGYKQTLAHRISRLAWLKDSEKLRQAIEKSSTSQRGIRRPCISGSRHPNYGNIGHLSDRKWVTNGIENKRIYINEEIPLGWRSGMLLKKKSSKVHRCLVGSFTNIEWEGLKRYYDFRCHCCRKQEPEVKLEKDHIVPVSLGGLNIIENIQPLCVRCNRIKKARIIAYRVNRFHSLVRMRERLESILRKRAALGLLDIEFTRMLAFELGVQLPTSIGI
jgi:5-methylcytosine-specific restriction endonuclease McrA